jgi:multicomponent Na+:H+ antiporter subunit D
MQTLVPLTVAVPLLAAALLAVTNVVANRYFADLVATGCAAAVTAMCALLVAHSLHRQAIVYWFGGWRPHDGVALGISFTADTIGAGMATLAGVLVTAALIFSWRYFEAIGNLFHALMLVFLAAMVGFCLTGDLFNMFVWFELMSGAAYALTAYKIEEAGPIQGAINFAITNTLGGFMILIGIALLYARTGALNLAQIGQGLAGHRADMLVLVALLLVLVGFLVKAAVVPLHFWLADAHAVAPTPVCVLFSGVMVELGLYAVARVYWTIFSSPLAAHAGSLRDILIWTGVISALVGALMCFVQHHLKRLLAFSTVSHAGIFLIGVALLSHTALAGTAVYVVAHGLAKGALFMGVGVLLHRFATVDEFELHGRGRDLPVAALGVFLLGGAVLAAAPMVGTFFGKSLVDESALGHGYHWLPAVLVVASAVTAGAVLRVTGRVFAGMGASQPPSDPTTREAEHEGLETVTEHDHTPATMLAPALLLALGGLVIGLVPGVVDAIERATTRFVDRGAYAATVLHGAHPHLAAAPPSSLHASDFVYASLSVVLALSLALAALSGPGLGRRFPRALSAGSRGALTQIRRLHSGHVGDYVAWLTFGLAALGGLFVLTLR